MWFVFIGGSIGEFFMSGLGVWAPTFFRRYHDLNAAMAGGLVALLALSTVAGIIVGSRRSTHARSRTPSDRIKMAIARQPGELRVARHRLRSRQLRAGHPVLLDLGLPHRHPNAPLQAVGLDTLVPHLRGRAMAVRSLLRVGAMALSPLLFGWLSDLYGLRSALLFTMPAVLAAGAITLMAVRTYEQDMEFAQAEAVRQHELEEALGEETVEDVLEDVLDKRWAR